jgi:Fe-Mn family superoxide dismutase
MCKKNLIVCLILFLLPVLTSAATIKELNSVKMPFSLPALPYALNALAPAIDQQTMELHHGKHHRAYFDKLNSVLTDKKYATLIDILKNTSQLPASVRNNAGGHWNHSFFWTIMTPESKESEISSKLKREIEKSFGSFASFKEKFEAGAKDVFGSGWVWLVKDADGKLKILTTANQDNPLMDISKETGTPILALDVWEHAYYLTYQNRRADYITGFWKVVNWKQVFDYYREK